MPQQVPIDAYGNNGFRFGGMSHTGSVMCLPTGMYALDHFWSSQHISAIRLSHITPLFEMACTLDVFFLGTGVTLIRPDGEIYEAFSRHNIVFEAMSTGSAARTYNIMVGEQRAVGAALYAVKDAT